MRLPPINSVGSSQIMTQEFGGLDKRLRIPDGALAADVNLSTDRYPLLAGRPPYATVTPSENIKALASKDALIFIDGAKVYVNWMIVSGLTLSTLETRPRQIVGMGALAVIFPDKVWVNTQDITKFGNLEQVNSVTAANVTFAPCAGDGDEYDLSDAVASDLPPSTPDDGDWWIDTSTVPHGLYRYSAGTGEWGGISAVYIKISAPGIGAGLNVYDGVTIAGIVTDDIAVKDQLEGLNGPGHPIYGAGDDYVIVAGMLDKTVTAEQTMSVKRAVPDMDYVCELDNRLWGCRYGIVNGEVVNEICASALGDPKVWDRYLGTSTDSYRVTVGSDGVFTAMVSHLGYVLAWKENCLHRIYGTQPSNFQLSTINCEGVERNSWQSVADVNGVLYYKGRGHILAYDGSLPQDVGMALDYLPRTNGYSYSAGGAWGSVYFISWDGKTYALDTRTGVWHTDNHRTMDYFVRHGDELFCRTAEGIVGVRVNSYLAGTQEPPFSWMAMFGPDGYELPGRKYLSRYNIRCAAAEGEWIEIWFRYDAWPSDMDDPAHPWELNTRVEGHGEHNTIMVPVRPRRCDHVQMLIVAGQHTVIYSIARILGIGGDGT